jgi:hypothetical protein
MWTEIYARKIKDTDLGGQVTPADKPFKMKMVNKVGFEDEFGYNPVLAFHNKESYNPPVAIQENLSFLEEKPIIRKLVIKDEKEEEDPW